MEPMTTATGIEVSADDSAASIARHDARMAQCRADEIAYYRRRLAAEIDREGVPRVDRQIPIGYSFATDADRWRVWCLDSLLWSFEELALGDSLHAFRGLLQAKEYVGHMGWPTSLIGDALSVMRNAIERVIRTSDGPPVAGVTV